MYQFLFKRLENRLFNSPHRLVASIVLQRSSEFRFMSTSFTMNRSISRTADVYPMRVNSKESRLFFIFKLNKCLQENQKLWQDKLKQTEEKLLQAEAARKQVSFSRYSAATVDTKIQIHLFAIQTVTFNQEIGHKMRICKSGKAPKKRATFQRSTNYQN